MCCCAPFPDSSGSSTSRAMAQKWRASLDSLHPITINYSVSSSSLYPAVVATAPSTGHSAPRCIAYGDPSIKPEYIKLVINFSESMSPTYLFNRGFVSLRVVYEDTFMQAT